MSGIRKAIRRTTTNMMSGLKRVNEKEVERNNLPDIVKGLLKDDEQGFVPLGSTVGLWRPERFAIAEGSLDTSCTASGPFSPYDLNGKPSGSEESRELYIVVSRDLKDPRKIVERRPGLQIERVYRKVDFKEVVPEELFMILYNASTGIAPLGEIPQFGSITGVRKYTSESTQGDSDSEKRGYIDLMVMFSAPVTNPATGNSVSLGRYLYRTHDPTLDSFKNLERVAYK